MDPTISVIKREYCIQYMICLDGGIREGDFRYDVMLHQMSNVHKKSNSNHGSTDSSIFNHGSNHGSIDSSIFNHWFYISTNLYYKCALTFWKCDIACSNGCPWRVLVNIIPLVCGSALYVALCRPKINDK